MKVRLKVPSSDTPPQPASYRFLKRGEVVVATDEFNTGSRLNPIWVRVRESLVGQKMRPGWYQDRSFRRKINNTVKSNRMKMAIFDEVQPFDIPLRHGTTTKRLYQLLAYKGKQSHSIAGTGTFNCETREEWIFDHVKKGHRVEEIVIEETRIEAGGFITTTRKEVERRTHMPDVIAGKIWI